MKDVVFVDDEISSLSLYNTYTYKYSIDLRATKQREKNELCIYYVNYKYVFVFNVYTHINI